MENSVPLYYHNKSNLLYNDGCGIFPHIGKYYLTKVLLIRKPSQRKMIYIIDVPVDRCFSLI